MYTVKKCSGKQKNYTMNPNLIKIQSLFAPNYEQHNKIGSNFNQILNRLR